MSRTLLLLPICFAGACGKPPATPVPTVVWISLDTTRADHVACTAAAQHRDTTPVANRLAASGVCFSRAFGPSSTTLVSHSSVFTGLDPHKHAVVRNGFPLDGVHERLPQRLQAAGWTTLAAVGSYALQREMGLEQGFDAYEDHGSWRGWFGLYEVNGETVTESALALVDERPADRPLFLFVHYYDAHMPWDSASSEVRERFVQEGSEESDFRGDRDGIGRITRETQAGALSPALLAAAKANYAAEVAWADAQVGNLLDGLEERGLLADSLIVVFADHGEVFTEVPERPWAHGPDVDLPIIHVPLIVAGRGRFALPVGAPAVDPNQARLLDIGSTTLGLLDLVGNKPLGDGVDLSAAWRGQPVERPPSFAEASKPIEKARTDTWPNLDFERAVVHGEHLYTRAPVRGEAGTLFGLGADQPIVQDVDRAATMAGLLDVWDAVAPGHRAVELDEETRKALIELGYLTEEPKWGDR